MTTPPEPDPPRGPELPTSEPLPIWDVFLSHGGPDKPWVQTLADELATLGLQPFLDVREIEPADSFPGVLSRGLAGSRFLVLILSPRSSRPWVDLEWQSFIAHHGPLGRILPVLLESTEIPALLASIQRIDATDRDAARVAREIAHIAGRGSSKRGISAVSSSARIWSSTSPGKARSCASSIPSAARLMRQGVIHPPEFGTALH